MKTGSACGKNISGGRKRQDRCFTRLQQLASDQGLKTTQNVAAGVAGIFIPVLWFGMDFQGTAGIEIRALQDRRQYLATFISGLAGTHAAGFVLTRQEAAGKWGAATYALSKTEHMNPTGHRTHRTHRSDATAPTPPTSPMGPMPDAVDDAGVPPGAEVTI